MILLGDTSPLFCYLYMISKGKIVELTGGLFAENGFFIVSLEVNPANRIRLQIDSMKGIHIDDCVKVSRIIEQGLDRDTEDFELEVSSPGIETPFRVKEQYTKNIGREVEIILKSGHTYRGILKQANIDFFSAEISKPVKTEGKKKKEIIKEIIDFKYNEATKVRALISF
jgi:ribosome maturation factor RimP